MQKISGTRIADEIIESLSALPKPKKFLAAFVVGDHAQTASFILQKEKTAHVLGVDFRVYRQPAGISSDQLRRAMHRVIDGSRCGGALLQLPLPAPADASYCVNAIPRQKDVDVLSERALGAFAAGRALALPPAVGAVEHILRTLKTPVAEYKKVVIVGSGPLVGKPLAVWFAGKVPEMVVLDKGSSYETLRDADLIITGTGVGGLVKGALVKKDAVLIDFGYGVDAHGKLSGDLDEESLRADGFVGSYTPTPGGTGPLVVAGLFENFYLLAHQ
ncbi:MAG: bifunctional 5,10-methylenetetrahydrofolate dehydrogenase/5,10-methenyltetrahydrofolate cyclohydrolase [Candidatus Paceibacterota bacterium]|jgi:methylenetetrahydrofolate dehydrogenase (NADP+)/methenyltetrahydrofolate cyclohydrolase